ncbi:MAG: hypothetical protein IJW90_01580 [Clostridia bacterium]|nr:hypothetical protein [Clostridia bacterium]
MYSKSMGSHYANGGQRRDPYRRPLYIPPNYRGTAMTVSPSSPYVELHEPDAESLSYETVENADRDHREETAVTEKTAREEKDDTPVSAAPNLLQSLLSGNHFPFGHGLGYEELLLLGLMLFLMREGEESGDAEDDRTLPLLLLGALLFMG